MRTDLLSHLIISLASHHLRYYSKLALIYLIRKYKYNATNLSIAKYLMIPHIIKFSKSNGAKFNKDYYDIAEGN